jgi:hypothetical protein
VFPIILSKRTDPDALTAGGQWDDHVLVVLPLVVGQDHQGRELIGIDQEGDAADVVPREIHIAEWLYDHVAGGNVHDRQAGHELPDQLRAF